MDFRICIWLIVGTSTGGILAFAWAKGIPLSDVITLYGKRGSKFIPKKVPDAVNRDLIV